MKAVIQPLAWGLAMASMLALASGVALDLVVDTAQAAVIHHDHDGHTAVASAVSDRQWPTDAALREGMTRLRKAADTALPNDPARPIGASQAMQLQADVEENVSFLIANCELPEQADAALHGLLADLLKGAKALAEPAERAQGAHRILATLNRYPEVFAPPHWNETTTVGR
ncbi:MAG TPA: DnrO protein [Pseudomonas sp.]|nr:DnrO protein [Pseudomonas sp.]